MTVLENMTAHASLPRSYVIIHRTDNAVTPVGGGIAPKLASTKQITLQFFIAVDPRLRRFGVSGTLLHA